MVIDLVVFFMYTRVSYSIEEDWEKLRRLLHYLKSTLELPRIIGINGLEILQAWVDTSYATHHEKRGHTGGVMSIVQDIIHGKSSKQKINIFFY